MANRKEIIPRNNTNFQLRLFEFLKKAKFDSKFAFLKYHQNLVRYYLNGVESGARGLLIYHQTGTGKSMVIISIAMDIIESGENRKVIFMLSKSLHENLRNAIKKYISLRKTVEPSYFDGQDIDEFIRANFQFVSMNASNMIGQLSPIDALDAKLGHINESITDISDTTILVDEAHNLFRSITNGSKNGIAFYELAMRARNFNIFFFTGTPINSNPFELVSCFNMLSGSHNTLPEDYRDFNRAFMGEGGLLKNKDKFQNRLFGLISFVSRDSTYGKAIGLVNDSRSAEFPEEYPLKVVYVKMDINQAGAYRSAKDLEIAENAFKANNADPPSMSKPKSASSSSYRVKTRMISNFFSASAYNRDKTMRANSPADIPVEELNSVKYSAILANIEKSPNQLCIVYSQFIGVAGLGTLARFLAINGYEEYAINGNIDKYNIADNLADIPKDGAVIAEESIGADNILEESIGADNIVEESIGADNIVEESIEVAENIAGGKQRIDDIYEIMRVGGADVKRFAAITGNVPVEDRQRIVEVYGSDENKYGAIILILLISASGAEGLDLKNVRQVHIMEPYWNYARVAQVIARGVRNDSHLMLGVDEKNVQPFIYLALENENTDSTDVELYKAMMADRSSIGSFEEGLREIAIECLINEDKNCRVCTPTNRAMFSGDLKKDLEGANPCSALKQAKLSVSEITYNGTLYYYKPDPESIYEYAVFTFDDAINAYRVVRENIPEFSLIIDAIENA
jgi:superfamily II DNA or RNA helicase